MRLDEFSFKQPFWVIVLSLIVILLGIVCTVKLPKDILPIFKTPAVQILTFYPGMPAEIVEKDMTTRLERWTGQSNGIAMQESKSMIGVSIVKDYFRPDIDSNTAMSQVTSLAMSDLYYLPPGTIPPMVMPFDPTASIPLALLSVGHPEMDETKLYDVAYFDLRNMLQGITGVIAPAVYGGRLRRILAYVDPYKMAEKYLSSLDVVAALRRSNVMIPTGNAKFGEKDFQIITNAMVPEVKEMNDFLIRGEEGVPVKVKDVGRVEDSHQIQSNVVRIDGKRSVYIPIYRQPGANTIDIVDGIQSQIKSLLERLPKGMTLKVIADQSQFVRQGILSLGQEVALGALLASLGVLLFLGSLRASFAVFLSIPLSIMACFIVLYATGETINAMTLGGVALAVGILIDNSVVVLENSVRHLEDRIPLLQAVHKGVAEVAMPVFTGTLCIVIVFLPIVFITGIGKFLFTPLAKSVTFSVLASYLASMTVIPLFCARFLRQTQHPESHRTTWFDRLATGYSNTLSFFMRRKKWVIGAVALLFIASLFLYPLVGKELFPRSDVGYITLYLRMPTGTRIEKTEEAMEKVETKLRHLIGQEYIESLITNIGVLYDWPAAYTPNSGPGDGFIELELKRKRKFSTEEAAEKIRKLCKEEFPEIELSINTGGLITAALNFGLTSPINIQVAGKDLKVSRKIAEEIAAKAKTVSGAVDVRILERLDYPQIEVVLDREAIAAKRLTVEEVVKNIVTALNSSVNFLPAFWIDEVTGNHYFLGAQYPEELIQSIETLKNLPLTGKEQQQVVLLSEIATFKETEAPSEIRHRNIRRVVNLLVNTSGRDIGSVAAEISKKIRENPLPEGYRVDQRGEVQSMQESFQNLGRGLLLAVVLIYLVLVGQFRSFRDPLLILIAVPLGLMGVLFTLWLTDTTLNIQSFIGVFFMAGIAVLNGVLMIEFANRLKREGLAAEEAVIRAARVRLRPILMTTCAALFSLLPMAIGFGHGAEANIPLARAVVGGLATSAALTLLVLPLLYAGIENWKPFSSAKKKVAVVGASILVALFLGTVFAQDTTAPGQIKILSLEEALRLALKQNPRVMLAQAQHEESLADLKIARAAYWPRINLSGMDSYGLGGSSSAIGITGLVNSPFRKDVAAGLDASWVAFDFGRTGFKVKSTKMKAAARKEEIALSAAEIQLGVIQAFLECVYYQELHSLLEARENRQQILVAEIDKYVQSGLTSPVELNLAQASLEKTRAEQVEALGFLQQSQERLKEWLGESDLGPFSCFYPEETMPALEPLPLLLNQALKNRPEIKAAQKTIEAAQAAKRAAQWERAPRLVAVTSAGFLENTNPPGGDEWSAGVGVTTPLFDGFKMEGAVQKATAQENQAQAILAQWKYHVRHEVASAYYLSESTQSLRKKMEEQYALSEKAYLLATERYKEKMGTFSEYRDAESAFNQAEQEKIKAKMTETLSYYQLLILSTSELP